MNASSRGGTETAELPLLFAEVDRLPDDLDALLCTADLQGVVIERDRTISLLGVALARHLCELAELDPKFPRPERTGVILAGDLYSVPTADVRGATGDVRVVWEAFADHFKFAAGVAGNHDTFGTSRGDRRRLESEPGIHLLDGTVAEPSGLRIGGVSGIIGDNVHKNERKRADDFLTLVSDVLEHEPDLLVLHQGPDGGASRLRGDRSIRDLIAAGPDVLTVCGHAHWPIPYAEPAPRCRVLNVDARAVLMVRSS